MDVEIRPIVAEEVPAFRRLVNRAFGGDATEDEAAQARFLDQVDLGRTYVPFEGDELVGTAAAFNFEVSLPGGIATEMAGLTMVSVLPTHRRRGLLTELMRAHFADCRQRGEALSGLWASESSIYGRYGYADAAPTFHVDIDAKTVGIPPAPDEVRLIDVAAARKIFPGIYSDVYLQRPGQLGRSDVWWEHRHFRDPEEWRQGASERRYVVARRAGRPVGFATYRQKAEWTHAVAAGDVRVEELVGLDAAARLSLWSLLCSIDLFPNVSATNLPLDFELPWQVANPRVVRRRVVDGMYVRLVDVPAALEARGYGTSDALTICVTDHLHLADGTFHLECSPEGAVCVPTDEEPDVVLDVAALASLYLGGGDASILARVGRIDGEPGAVRRLAAALRSDTAPCCHEVF